MVAFVGSFLVIFAMIGAVLWYGQKRPAGAPVTWGEAMFGAVLAFACMFWAYGVVPQAWIMWSANELGWRPDQMLTGPSGSLVGGPVSLSKAGLADIITVLIYGFMIQTHVILFIYWNRRGKIQAAARLDEQARGKRKAGRLTRKGQLT